MAVRRQSLASKNAAPGREAIVYVDAGPGTRTRKVNCEEMPTPKYAELEIERRWLVNGELLGELGAPYALILDRYLLAGRLRLRRMELAEETVFKFGKKYAGEGVYEAITNLYLDRSEFEILSQLPAYGIEKKRFRLQEGVVDVYEAGGERLIIYEANFGSEKDAAAFIAPDFALDELQRGSEYSGFAIARRLSETGWL